MYEGTVVYEELDRQYIQRNGLTRFMKIFLGRKIVQFGFIIIICTILTALFAPALAPYDPYKSDLFNTLSQPSRLYLLGTDSIGRDTLSRLIYGTRTSLLIGLLAVCIASVVGLALGLIAGYFGGFINAIIMRFIDTLMSFPMLVLALLLATVLGGGLTNVVLALGIGLMSMYARLMCGQVLTIKEMDYIAASKSIGAGNPFIILRHVLPNCFPPLIVLITTQLGGAILAEAMLSFLGIGIAAPAAAWGAMVNEGYSYLRTNPILSFAPGFAIMLVVLAFNMIGDGLRDALDPRLRGKL